MSIIQGTREQIWQAREQLSLVLLQADTPLEIRFRYLRLNPAKVEIKKSFTHPAPPFSLLYPIEEGSIRVFADEREYEFGPGEILLLPDRMSFEITYAAGTKFASITYHVTERNGRSIFSEINQPLAARDPQLAAQINQCVASGDHWQAFSLISVATGKLIKPRLPQLFEQTRRAQSFKRLFDYLQTAPIAQVRIADLADLYHVEPDTLGKRFRRIIGVPLKQYLLDEQMRRAQILLLHSDDSVKEIAAKLGHFEPQYFHRLFQRHCHMTPLAFRERNRGGTGGY